MDQDINFAAQCLIAMSNSKYHGNGGTWNASSVPLDLSPHRGAAVIVDKVHDSGVWEPEAAVATAGAASPDSAGSAPELYMVARILTDLTSIKQEPVPNVPSDDDGGSSAADELMIDEEEEVVCEVDMNDGASSSSSARTKRAAGGGRQGAGRKAPSSGAGSRPGSRAANAAALALARKVHRCDFDGCDKVYGKSSHLKAHNQTTCMGMVAPLCELAPQGPPSNSHRGATIPMHVVWLWQEVRPLRRASTSHAHAHRREELLLSRL